MTTDSNYELNLAWEKVLKYLSEVLAPQVIDTWIKTLVPVKFSGDKLVLSTPKFNREWIISRYLSNIENAVRETLGENVIIDIETTDINSAAPHFAYKTLDEDITKATVVSAAITQPYQTSLKMEQFNDSGEEIIAMLAPGDNSSLNPRYTFESFVTGKSNQLAHAAAIAVANSPGNSGHNPLFMYGGVGLGKTHLMQAIGNKVLENDSTKRVLYISSENFTNEFIRCIQRNKMESFRKKYRSIDVLLIDDIQFFAGQERTQEEFFHTFNALRDANKQIILSSDKPAREVAGLEERLLSRFGWGMQADIQAPDFETRIAILKKKATVDNVSVSDDVIIYIANHINTNIRELEGALTRLVTYASIDNRPINSDLVVEALRNIIPNSEETIISIDIIDRMVASYFSVTSDDLKSNSRKQDKVLPRQVAMYLSRELTSKSLPEIGKYFGNKDHTTVMHACEKINNLIATDPEIKRTVESLVGSIKKI